MRESAAFRVQMAELGHPVIGPQSFNKLTMGEVRVYAEGLQYQAEQKEQAQRESEHGPNYNQQSKQKRDENALQSVEERVHEHEQSGAGPDRS